MNEKDIEKIADRVAERLIQISKTDKYKETEAMLRAYPNYKRIIEKNNEGLPELELERIEHLKSENAKVEKRIIRVDNALEGIKNDGYYDIIILRYFKEWTIDGIAEDFDVDRKTIGRNRTRLVKKLQYSLFPELLLD